MFSPNASKSHRVFTARVALYQSCLDPISALLLGLTAVKVEGKPTMWLEMAAPLLLR